MGIQSPDIVTLNDQVISFEPDEERNYRALSPDPQNRPDLQLVQAIAASIASLFK